MLTSAPWCTRARVTSTVHYSSVALRSVAPVEFEGFNVDPSLDENSYSRCICRQKKRCGAGGGLVDFHPKFNLHNLRCRQSFKGGQKWGPFCNVSKSGVGARFHERLYHRGMTVGCCAVKVVFVSTFHPWSVWRLPCAARAKLFVRCRCQQRCGEEVFCLQYPSLLIATPPSTRAVASSSLSPLMASWKAMTSKAMAAGCTRSNI